MSTSTNNFFEACRSGDLTTVEMIYKDDPPIINSEDEKGFTPLIIAVYNNHPAVVNFLLDNGANTAMPDLSGNSALMGVCFKGYTHIAAQLIKAGVDVNQRNGNGATALTFAATFGHLEIAEMLLQQGASINIRDSRGKSPLDHARIQENEAMIALLEKYATEAH